MDKNLEQLVEISRFFGSDKNFVIAGGGNTSYKDQDKLWVKASGTSLDEISINDFVVMDRTGLSIISERTYSDDPQTREQQVKEDLLNCVVDHQSGKRPSVETSIHEIIRYRYVVHTHPTLINALMCSQNAANTTAELFPDTVLFVPYTDPGYTLFKRIENDLEEYRKKYNCDPGIIFLENHGVIVSADSPEEIKALYAKLVSPIRARTDMEPGDKNVALPVSIEKFLPAIRAVYQTDYFPVARFRSNSILLHYTGSKSMFQKISKPLTPDMVVYCRSSWIYIENTQEPDMLLNEFMDKLVQFEKKHNYKPRILVLKNIGIVGIHQNSRSADIVLDIFEDHVKVNHYAASFGGAKPLSPEQIEFIDTWEVEKFRRAVLSQSASDNPVKEMVCLVTGGAQGFGKGICESFFREGANVIIADINTQKGKELEEELNSRKGSNQAYFIRTDVSDLRNVEEMMVKVVAQFGGLDVLVSNAGVLKAGSLEEMDAASFDYVTRTNYGGYFNCAKIASEVFKLQHKHNPETWFDIIQINSKSGLKGSKKNFSYAGSKFGGIGLTQSFALELIEYGIKVNAVCPGNFFDGPLWSDPVDGLFVQYLKAGKVPGAKSLGDVRRFYEDQIPFGRGCEIEDVMKAIWYVIGQKYETGQAIPVTGGQIMIN
jgi:NAD(P)-dependent dehydrogenase (short-subunit alcohol dehydrogenase family)/rhamnose utilization protein RhaD (predicted bifunctional aldolase and dehydrogenase)